MTDSTDRIDDGIGTYDVVLLVEHQLSVADAAQVHSLHEEIADQVVYHVLVPMEDAAARIEAAMGSLGAADGLAAPSVAMGDVDLAEVRRDCEERAESELAHSLTALRATGARTLGRLIEDQPVDALAATVEETRAREAIVITSPHVVAEFFHLDWSSQARRRLGVPVLHLLEHESFDEQAGGGEGISGL